MSVKIMIERNFKADFSPEDLVHLNELRIAAMREDGYISGETLVNLDNNAEVVVLSIWSSLDDWEVWSKSEERAKLENELAPHLQGPTKIRPFMLSADAMKEVFEKFVHDSEVTES